MRCKTKHLARACKTTAFFSQKLQVNGCKNRKPLIALKPQYRELK